MVIKNSTLEQESAILDRFRSIDTKNPKKIRRLAQSLYFESPHSIQKKMCMDILKSSNPAKMLHEYLSKIDDFVILHHRYLEDGHHGMLMTGDRGETVYPVSLDVNPNWIKDPNDLWNPDDEAEIMLELARAYLATTTLRKALVKLILFQDYGFSGVPRIFEVFRHE